MNKRSKFHSGQQSEESVGKTPEPYKCVGNFATDFTELYKEKHPNEYAVAVRAIGKPVLSSGFMPDAAPSQQASKKNQKAESKKLQSVVQPVEVDQVLPEDKESQLEDGTDEIIDALDFKPKHFIVKPTFASMKPCIFVETDNIDKNDNINEIVIRRWKVEADVLDFFGLSFPVLSKLTTLNFWRVGLTSEMVKKLGDLLSNCEHINHLTLDQNMEAEEENYYELIKPESHLTKLRLRYCNLSPVGAKLMAEELGSLTNENCNITLLQLDLSGNKLGDHGAVHFAQVLKINRVILSLNLSNCDIGDDGCTALARSLSQYVLSTEEIFARRRLLSNRNAIETAKSMSRVSRASVSSQSNLSPPTSRRGDSKDRPVSVRSSIKDEKTKKDKAPIKGKKETKEEKAPPKGKKEDKATKKPTALMDPAKNNAKAKGKPRSSKQNSNLETMSDTTTESIESSHPLLSKIEELGPGKLRLTGNFMLLMLNLSRNRISEEGLINMLEAVNFQVNHMNNNKVNGTGLLKLFIQSNNFDPLDKNLQSINAALIEKDRKAKTPNSETELGH